MHSPTSFNNLIRACLLLTIVYLPTAVHASTTPVYLRSTDVALTVTMETGDGMLFFHATVKNIGPDTAENITLTDVTPQSQLSYIPSLSDRKCVSSSQRIGYISCLIESLQSGESLDLDLAYTILECNSTTLTHQMNAWPLSPDPHPENNVNTDVPGSLLCDTARSSSSSSEADISVTIAAPLRATSGSLLPLTATIRNDGPADAQNVIIHYPVIPTLQSFVIEEQTHICQWDNDLLQNLHCSLGTLAKGTTKTLVLTYRLQGCTPSPLRQTITIDSPTPDLAIRNNTSNVANTILSCDKIPLPPPSTTTETADTSSFSDIDSSSLLAQAIQGLNSRHVFQGFPDGTFRPDQPVTRAEAAKLLLTTRFSSLTTQQQKPSFSDVAPEDWFAPYIAMATEKAIILGYPDGTFRPMEPVRTAEFLKMSSLTFSLKLNLPFAFRDVVGNEWFAPYAGAASLYKLFPSHGRALHPDAPLTRGETAIALWKILQISLN
ncbi:MAG: S-layer homology domain-containing protein [Candidatus Peregrinibacteria bacterium]